MYNHVSVTSADGLNFFEQQVATTETEPMPVIPFIVRPIHHIPSYPSAWNACSFERMQNELSCIHPLNVYRVMRCTRQNPTTRIWQWGVVFAAPHQHRLCTVLAASLLWIDQQTLHSFPSHQPEPMTYADAMKRGHLHQRDLEQCCRVLLKVQGGIVRRSHLVLPDELIWSALVPVPQKVELRDGKWRLPYRAKTK